MADARLATDATGSEIYSRALILAGANKASAGLVLAPITPAGTVRRGYFPAANNTFSLALGRSGILTSTLPTSTTLLVPTMATLGHTRLQADGNYLEIAFLVQRGGTGQMFVNFDTGVTLTTTNDLDVSTLPVFHPPVLYVSHGDNLWHIE